jgi:PLP dependent protein
MTLAATIQTNFEVVQTKIDQAARSAGRDPGQVKLVVVTKAQPLDVVQSVIEAGAQILGENYPEETVPKIHALGRPHGLAWHMIGHLQSRKAGLVVASFDLLQSLDSLHLAEKLNHLAAEQGTIFPVMIEFNVGGEESKHGWPASTEQHWDALLPTIEALFVLQNLSIRGLMTMPPWNENAEQSRPYFITLRRMANFFAKHFGEEHFRELSMGTSTDFIPAVQEGATLVRVGTAIVGPRPPK